MARRTTRTRLTVRGTVTLALAALATAGGAFAAYPGLMGLGAALAVLVVASLASVLVRAPLRVVHDVRPARVPRLGEAAVHVELANGSGWYPLQVAGTYHVAGEPAPVTPAWLAPGRRTTTAFALPTTRRGVLEVGPFVLDRRGVADLAGARSTLGGLSMLTVTPRILPVRAMPAGHRRGHVGSDERVEHGGTDLVGMREYVPGDDLRRLHWATSARTGTLMVREDADPPAPHLTVVLDDRASSYHGDGFEEAIDLVASLVVACSGHGTPVRAVAASGSLDVDVTAGVPGTTAPGRVADDVLDRLTTLGTAPSGPGPDGSSLVRPGGVVDVLAVVSGAGAGLAELLLACERAADAVVLLVDPAPGHVVEVVGAATVLRGPGADDLVRAWDATVDA